MRVTHVQAINALLLGREGTFGKRNKITKDEGGNMRWLYHGSANVSKSVLVQYDDS